MSFLREASEFRRRSGSIFSADAPAAKHRIVLLPLIGILATLVFLSSGCEESPKSIRSDKEPYLERRAKFATRLTKTGPAPQGWEEETPPQDVREIVYPSGELSLRGALFVPSGEATDKRPALVFFHGGFAFDYGSLEYCRSFMDAGFVVLMPFLRAENGGPGHYELLLGEVDDAANAIRWLSRQSYVDPKRIYTFGHSVGAGISAMLSLLDDLPIRHGGGAGGLYSKDIFSGWGREGILPFNLNNPRELQMRLLMGNVRWMKRSHYAYIGKEDTAFLPSVIRLHYESMNEHKRETLIMKRVHGDHLTCLQPALEDYFKMVREKP